MTYYYVSYEAPDYIIITKTYNIFKTKLQSCNIVIPDIENIINLYIGSDEHVKINVIQSYDSQCLNNDEMLNTYVLNIIDQKICNQIISAKFTLDIHRVSRTIHLISVHNISFNVIELLSDSYYDINFIILANLFMKSKLDATCICKNAINSIIENDAITLYGIEGSVRLKIHNRRLFKNVINMIDCIIQYSKKIDICKH